MTTSLSIRMLSEIPRKSSLESGAMLMKTSLGKRRVAHGRPETPGAPNVADWEAQQTTHLPFRDRPPHRSVPAEVREIPEVGIAWQTATTRSQCFSRKTAIRV